MFTTVERLEQRTGKNFLGRNDYIGQLVIEFKESKSLEAKQQVLANLANFAYDPVNYEFLRGHSVIDLFLEEVTKNEVSLLRFALAGLCNLALDFKNKDYILSHKGVSIVGPCLYSEDDEVVLSSITTLMFLIKPESKSDITSSTIIRQMLVLSSNPNGRISNLATIFLEDYCNQEQIDAIRSETEPVAGPSH